MSLMLSTGISGLDDVLRGGIPQGNCVLVAGSAGTGKTVLSHQFLIQGAKLGQKGVYLSFVESSDKIMKNLKNFKFYNQKYFDEQILRVIDVTKVVRLKGVEYDDISALIAIIRGLIEETNAKRIVIDSITALCENIGNRSHIRDFIMELGYQLEYLECTSIMISEIPPQKFTYSIHGVEEFIADGVILLSDFDRKGELIRMLQVVKMRGVNHSRNKQVMKILDDGVNILPMFKAGVE